MLRAFDSVKRRVGLQRNAPNFRIQFFQTSRSANESSAGAEHGNKMGDSAFGLLPDLVSRPEVMRLPVGVVRILVSVEIFVGMIGVELARYANRAVGAIRRIGINNVRSVGMQNMFTLDGYI